MNKKIKIALIVLGISAVVTTGVILYKKKKIRQSYFFCRLADSIPVSWISFMPPHQGCSN